MAAKLDRETRTAIRRYGPQADRIAKKYGLSGEALLTKLVVGESGGRAGAVSSAGARGRTQFMPGTRKIAMQKFGVDPWRSADEAIHAAVLHLEGKLTGSKGLEGYNPGDPNYPSYILNQKIGNIGAGGAGHNGGSALTPAPAPPVLGGDAGRTRQKEDVEGALLDALISGSKKPASQAAHLLDTGAYTTTVPSPSVQPSMRAPHAPTPSSGGGGQVRVSPNANRPGHDLKPYLTDFTNSMTRWSGDIEIGTGTRHNRLTVNGKVSDHWDGSAADIPATGKRGDEIAYAAFRAAGVDAKKARRWASNGGLYNVTRNGVRYQIIWKTNEGGNHFNHVHVGVKPT